MAIYIKGVELPTNCLICPFTEKDDRMGTICYFTNIVALNIGRQKDCPLTEVPEPHGRLIDADKAIEDYANYGISHPYDAYDLEEIMTDSPTVIERSK